MQLPLFNWLYCRNMSCSLDAVNTPWGWVVESLDASSTLYLKVWNLFAPWGQIPLPPCSSQGWLHKEECNTTPALCTPQMNFLAAVSHVPTVWLSVGKANPVLQSPQLPLPSSDGVDVPWHLPRGVKVTPVFGLRVVSLWPSGGVVCPETGVHLWISSHVFTLLFLTTYQGTTLLGLSLPSFFFSNLVEEKLFWMFSSSPASFLHVTIGPFIQMEMWHFSPEFLKSFPLKKKLWCDCMEHRN